MRQSDSFVEFILEQLANIPRIKARRVFGAHGLYRGDRFFGIIDNGTVYFKTDAKSVGDYTKRGMEPFKPTEKQTLKNYYEVPADIIENRDELTRWANRAAGVGGKTKRE